MADRNAAGELDDRMEIASYVATLSADLAVMARRSGLDPLGYLLEMVQLEAETIYRHGEQRTGARN